MTCRRWLLPSLGIAALVACGEDGGDDPGGGSDAGTSGASSAGDGGRGGAGASSSGNAGAGGGGRAGAAGNPGSAGSSAGDCGSVTTFETGIEPETVLHVALGGSADATGSEDDPFDGIEAAAAAATPGTAIRVHAGDYPGDVFLAGLAGTADAPIWIGGAPGEAPPTIGGAAFDQAIHLSGGRYVVLHDLVIASTTVNGINADDGSAVDDGDALRYVVFRDLSIRDIGTGGNHDCLKLSGANAFWVLDSEFSNCSVGGSGVDMVGCHGGLLARNEFSGGGNAVQAKGGSEDVEIRANRFVDSAGRAVNLGGSTGFEFFRPPLAAGAPNAEARDIRLVSNVFDRPSEAIAFTGCVGCLAANNTVYLPAVRILRILQETAGDATYAFSPASDGRVVNNVFVYRRAEIANDGRAINVGAGTSPETFAYEANLWYASDDAPGSEPSTAYSGATVTGTLAAADPGFTDAGAGDFSIGAASPVAAAGVDLPAVPADRAGRCFATPRAVGAFEAPAP